MYGSAEIARLIDCYVSFVGNSLNNPDNPIPSGEKAELRWWEQRCRLWDPLEKVSLPQLIDAIGEFPVLPLILDFSPTNMCIIQGMKVPSRALSWLLKPLMLGEPLHSGMPLKVWSHYGLAQISKTRFNLATETFVRSAFLQSLFPSAAVLWGCCECSDSRDRLERSGVIGDPTIVGKTDYLSHQTRVIQNYMDLEVETTSEPPKLDWRRYLPNLLYWESYKIAQTDGCFEEHHYRPFWRVWQRFNNVVLKRDNVQGVYVLPDESIFVTGSHNKIPKGFQPKNSPAWRPAKKKRRREL